MHNGRLRIYIIILLGFFVELILFDKLRISGIKPEILLIITVFFGFHFGTVRGMEIGALSGVLKGIFSITGFWINTFSFLLIGFLSGYLKDKLFKENFVTQTFFSFFSVYLVWSISILCGQVPVGTGLFPTLLNTAVLCKGLYTGILAPFLFIVLTKTFGPRHTE